MLTNLTAHQATVKQLAAIYRARWAVEIQFRAWKQALRLGQSFNRYSNSHHIHSLVLAGMIAHQLWITIASRLAEQWRGAQLSFEKLYHALACHLVRASDLLESKN